MAERAIGALAHRRGLSFEAAIAEVLARYPLRRMADPVEIAGTIAFLVSSDASFVTGATIVADGGGGIVDVGTLAFAG